MAGLSPQVITETLYCLLVRRTAPTDVRAIHVVTTTVGKRRILDALLRPRVGWFHRFCREYRIPQGRIRFSARTIHVVTAADGTPLDDVRSAADHGRIADAILDLVRDLTRDPGMALHASVAGGRKTMGLFLGIAFQLLARPQDRLSHVLVSPPDLESHPEFYYPPPVPTTYRVARGTRTSVAARVELAEIPVLRLHGKVGAAAPEGRSYSALIAAAQEELDRDARPPALVLDPRSRVLRIADRVVRLTGLEYALYTLFARRRTACGDAGCPGCGRCGLRAKDFLGEAREGLRAILRELEVRDERARSLAGWETAGDERFLQIRSRIERKLRQALGSGPWSRWYGIAAEGARGETHYRIPLAPRSIREA